MKVYIVDRDDSGLGTADYGIAGIFSTMEKAEDFIKKVDKVNRRYCYDITITELDNPGKEMLNLSVFMTD